MLPTAGLYLPETSHSKNDFSATPNEAERTRLRSFQWKNARQRQELKGPEDGISTLPVKGLPTEDSTNVFTSLATAFNFADIVSSSNKASSETVCFANLIQGVRQDIVEASRLYHSPAVSSFLDAWPDKRTWVELTLHEVRHTLNEIGLDMDATRVNRDDDASVVARRKFEWFLSHQKRHLKKQNQLQTCQRELAGAIHVMQTAEMCGLPGGMLEDPIHEAPVRPWIPVDDRDALRGPYSRQKLRASHINLSVSTVALSDVGEDYTHGKYAN